MRCTIRGGSFFCVGLHEYSRSCSLVRGARQAVLSGWLHVPRLLFCTFTLRKCLYAASAFTYASRSVLPDGLGVRDGREHGF